MTHRPKIHIEYLVDNQPFQTWTYDAIGIYSRGRSGKEEILDQFGVGERYAGWYDPSKFARYPMLVCRDPRAVRRLGERLAESLGVGCRVLVVG